MPCVLTRTSRTTVQRFTRALPPTPRPMNLTLSALGFAAGGKSVHELLGEVLATKLIRAHACCPIVSVTSFKHCDAIALFALLLATSLAAFLISADSSPAQAFASPRRSALILVVVSSMQKSVADAALIPQSKRTVKSTIILRVRDSIFIVFRGPVLGLAYRFLPFAARSFPGAPTARECLAMQQENCVSPPGVRAWQNRIWPQISSANPI